MHVCLHVYAYLCVCTQCVSCTASVQPLAEGNSGKCQGHPRLRLWLGRGTGGTWEEQPFRFWVLCANPMTNGAEVSIPNPNQEGNGSEFIPASNLPPSARCRGGQTEA